MENQFRDGYVETAAHASANQAGTAPKTLNVFRRVID